jgi:hypothetical protein
MFKVSLEEEVDGDLPPGLLSAAEYAALTAEDAQD